MPVPPARLLPVEKRRGLQVYSIRQQLCIGQFRIIGKIGQGQVQPPLVEQRIQVPDQSLRQQQFHPRVQGTELLQDHRQQGFTGDPGKPQPDLSAPGIPDIMDFLEGFPVFLQQFPGHPGIDFPSLGQIDSVGIPYQKRHPGFFFYCFDDPAQRRLGKAQLPGRPCDIPLFTDQQEVPQVFLMEHRVPSLYHIIFAIVLLYY